jgi:hypothetical protein
MAREHIDYRNNLELLLEAFPDRKVLMIRDVANYTGRSRGFVKKQYFADSKNISLPALARKLCG